MPHKRNPITWERLTGLARVLRGNAVAALENVALWHERDISHSSVERIIFPDSCTLLDYMFGLLTRLMDGLVVYPANMKKNLGLSLGMWNSQTVLLALIKKGLTREAAYKLVQDAAMKTWEVKHAGRDDADFVEQLKSTPEVAKHFKPRRTGKTLLARLPFQGSEEPVQETGTKLNSIMYSPASTRYDSPEFYRRCGRSGVKLPLISLGLWHNFGAKDSFDNARAIALPRV